MESNFPAKTTIRPFNRYQVYEEPQRLNMPVIIIPDNNYYKILENPVNPDIDYKILEIPTMRKFHDKLKKQYREKQFRFSPHNFNNQLWQKPKSLIIPAIPFKLFPFQNLQPSP